MKDKQAKIKKIKKGLKLAALGLLISATITSAVGCRNVKYDEYASTSEIVSVMDELDCDASYLTKYGDKYLQMEHNGDEPIYVCFDNSLTKEEIESAKKSLDEIFGIMGRINKNYKYEIVDTSVYNSKLNRTKIYYRAADINVTDLKHSSAFIVRNPSLLSFLTNKRVYNNYNIVYNRLNYIDDEYRDYIFMHELFHAFGADDIYSMENGVRAKPKAIKTIMDTDYGDGTSKLSPNDVKCLISLYQEKKNSKDEQEKYLDEMNEFLQEYEKEYYSTFANKCKEKTNYGYTFDERKVNIVSSIDILVGKEKWNSFKYDVKILDNKYKFTIKKETGKVLDSCTGEVVWMNDVAILKDVTLQDGLYPEMPEGYVKFQEFVQDLAVLKNDQNNLYLYDLGTNLLWPTETLVLSHTDNIVGV